ncbi:tyrosine aminotransferase [Euwallacea similis]|uniref:tyrosine aminotransferase n=1 Tax=Euwallacea similis TaxID=1736056 RepID=UPI00344C6C62
MLDKLIKSSDIFIDSAKPNLIELGKRHLWKVEPTSVAKNCKNVIRDVVENLDLQPNPEKPVIALSLGDPTIYGNLKPSSETTKAMINVLEEGNANGYNAGVGSEIARKAVAEYLSFDGVQYQPKDIILCSGCSCSLELCITALADPIRGHNILMPRPGFSIYQTIAGCFGVEVKYYNLIPENNWEVDLDHLDTQIDSSTAAIILNNPSNPCGSNYREEHLRNILEIAHKHRVPVIADEIYDRLVFPGKKFTSTAALHSEVPILVCGGLAKRFLVPGWRLGWIAVHDEIGAFEHVRKSLVSLSQRIIGSNTLVQAALPAILQTPSSFHQKVMQILAANAQVAFDRFGKIKGLIPFMPEGAMYMVVEIDMRHFPNFESGLEFCKKMMEEESVFCLPGECFQIPGFMRIVLSVPKEVLEEACERIAEYCNRHYVD